MELFDHARDKIADFVSKRFPERQIYLRTNGSVKLQRLSSKRQLTLAGCTLAFAAVVGTLAVSFLDRQTELMTKERELRQREAQVATLETQLRSMSKGIRSIQGSAEEKADAYKKRHEILEDLFESRLGISLKHADKEKFAAVSLPIQPHNKTAIVALSAEKPQELAAVSAGTEVAMTPPIRANGSAMASAEAAVVAQYDTMAREQLTFVKQAAVAADARFHDRLAMLKRLRLDHRRFMGSSNAYGMGGPLLETGFTKSAFAALEPQFKDLLMAWTKLDSLDKALGAIPSLKPVRAYTYTSGFGVRYDPFRGTAARHSGVDMAGMQGEPIYAAADGVVTRASYWGAYGNVVEVDHGRGLSTRYGHMSRIAVRSGTRVRQGELVGKMGSTGRSTGPHLHYEVRVDGQAVNPMPFLEASADVLEVQRRASAQSLVNQSQSHAG